MRNQIVYIVLILLSSFILEGCNIKKDFISGEVDSNMTNNSSEVINSMKVFINNKEYNLELEDNDTVKELIKLLPLQFEMNELNGNEKYAYLDAMLPTNSTNPYEINTGDVMLYGNNCLVIFYKTFKTNYSYTKIGHIDNMPNLDSKSVSVKITKYNN